MNIRVRLFGLFRIDRFNEEDRSFQSGTSARQVIEELQLPFHLLGIILINERHAELDDFLQEGDSISILPLFGGG
ncbi:MoaD/ThiS family protein [Geopsychrobacter electrodiphilus]|uniref:MoaD/ThiS family protein n=1 Tax=Geopsychrobacter electrodiphilus TaxID=225196 RepID=UPI000380A396|nr:MoaD/ThiS family protein [Geopsychrobacter electrodiphilus]